MSQKAQVIVKLLSSSNFNHEGFFGKGKEGKKEKGLDASIKVTCAEQKHHGETYKDCKNPTFNELFLFDAPLNASIFIQAYAHEMVTDKEIGELSVNLSGCEPNSTTAIEMPFKHKKNAVTAQIKFQVTITLHNNTVSIPSMKIPRMMMFLEKSKFLAGDVVRGAVTLHVGKDIKYKTFRVNLLGIQEFRQKLEDKTTKSSKIVSVHGEIGSEKKEYAVGEYIIPFSLALAHNLPPSGTESKWSKQTDDDEKDQFRHVYTLSVTMEGIKGYNLSEIECTKHLCIFNDYTTVELPKSNKKEEKQKGIKCTIEPKVPNKDLYFTESNADFNVKKN